MHQTNQFCIDRNKWIPEDLVTSRLIRIRLQQKNRDAVTLNDVESKFGLEHTEMSAKNNPFLLSRQCVTNTYYRNLQFRILHNVYPKNKKLYKWNIKPTPWCSSCGEDETLKHVLVECRVAKGTFTNLKTILCELGLDSNLSNHDIILGRPDSNILSHILIRVKAALLQQQDSEKRIITIQNLKGMILQEYRIELYNSRTENNLQKIKAKWKCMKNCGIGISQS